MSLPFKKLLDEICIFVIVAPKVSIDAWTFIIQKMCQIVAINDEITVVKLVPLKGFWCMFKDIRVKATYTHFSGKYKTNINT